MACFTCLADGERITTLQLSPVIRPRPTPGIKLAIYALHEAAMMLYGIPMRSSLSAASHLASIALRSVNYWLIRSCASCKRPMWADPRNYSMLTGTFVQNDFHNENQIKKTDVEISSDKSAMIWYWVMIIDQSNTAIRLWRSLTWWKFLVR